MALLTSRNAGRMAAGTRSGQTHRVQSIAARPVDRSIYMQGRVPVPRGRAVRPARAAARVVTVEANLFSRVVRIVQSYVSSFTSQFEDPEVLLDRVTDEMQEDLIKMRQTAARVMGSEKQMAAKYNQVQGNADEWLRRAELAVRKGQDELAREALLRRKTFEGNAAAMRPQLQAQRKAMEQLNANIRMLENKLSEAKNKKETLKARAATAKSSKQIQEMVAGLRINNSSAWAAFDKMEEKVMSMEAEAETAGMLATPDSVEQKFLALEGGSVEDELSQLKKGMITASSASRNVESLGRPVSEVLVGRVREPVDAIDAELEALRKRARS